MRGVRVEWAHTQVTFQAGVKEAATRPGVIAAAADVLKSQLQDCAEGFQFKKTDKAETDDRVNVQTDQQDKHWWDARKEKSINSCRAPVNHPDWCIVQVEFKVRTQHLSKWTFSLFTPDINTCFQ